MKVLLGLSGGVDSAVAAYLLIKAGHEVTACFMRNWDALANNDYLGNPTLNENQCPQEKDYDDAMAVAKKLNIPFIRNDYIKEYWDNVFSYLIKEYAVFPLKKPYRRTLGLRFRKIQNLPLTRNGSFAIIIKLSRGDDKN